MDSERVSALVEALERYREARLELLGVLGLPLSNREPLAEWSEHLVAAVLDGKLAESPVKSGWDMMTPAGEKVQVRSLNNRAASPAAGSMNIVLLSPPACTVTHWSSSRVCAP